MLESPGEDRLLQPDNPLNKGLTDWLDFHHGQIPHKIKEPELSFLLLTYIFDKPSQPVKFH